MKEISNKDYLNDVMKNVKRNSIIILIVTIVVLYFILKDNFKQTLDILVGANQWLILLTFVMYGIYLFLETYIFHMVTREYKEDYPFIKSFSINMVNKFFSGITPLATGGEPMQVYELKQDGIRMTDGTNIVIQNYVLYQLGLVFFGLIAIIFNYSFHLFNNVEFLKLLVLVGFGIHLAMVLLLLLVSFNKKFSAWAVRFGIKVLSKFKLIKNPDKAKEKMESSCEKFYEGAQHIKENKREFFIKLAIRIVSFAFYYSIPFFITLAIGEKTDLTLWISIVASSYVYFSGSYVPIPGASGGMEFVFLSFFGNFMAENPLAVTMVVWRFVTYFFPTILGGVIYNIRKQKKAREEAKKEIIEN